MKKNLVVAFFLVNGLVAAQSDLTYREENSIPLYRDPSGDQYKSPWSGGLNSSEVSTIDLDFDGKQDLVIFDRTAQKVITYLNTSSDYQYVPAYENHFPGELYNWLLLRDFDGDGLKDIFTGHIFGISVYRNVSTGGKLKWEPFLFYDGSSSSEVVLTQGLSGRINLQLQFDDLPSISDADDDGDVDIFVMNYGGAGTIEFHKNMSVEKYGISDSLDYELVDNWWGGVRECTCGEFVFNKESCPPSPGRVKHAGGKSLLLMDGNGDGVRDMLVTEGECSELYILFNTGTVDAPLITTAAQFPTDNPATFNYYPTAYYEDVNFDGVKDLLVTPNVFSKSDETVDLAASHWRYTNTGSNAQPNFLLSEPHFLQGDMLDVGDNSVPALADYDSDGDIDLFISNNGNPSVIRLYKNTGSAFAPVFALEDGDFRQLAAENFTNMRISIADIDNDGRQDLVFTATRIGGSATRVYLIRNKASSGLDFTGQNIEQLNISVARPENISFVDVDRNGRVDILKGKSNGAVEYWRNGGTPNLEFLLEQNQYLGIGPSVTTNNLSFAESDLNGDGKSDLIISDQTGKLSVVQDFRNASDLSGQVQDIVYDSLNGYYAPNLGGRTWVATAGLYGSLPVIVAGNTLGGIRILRNTNEEQSGAVVSIYPNPIHSLTKDLKVVSSENALLTIFNSKGQQVRSTESIAAKSIHLLPLKGYAAGMYLLQFHIGNKMVVRRLIVI